MSSRDVPRISQEESRCGRRRLQGAVFLRSTSDIVDALTHGEQPLRAHFCLIRSMNLEMGRREFTHFLMGVPRRRVYECCEERKRGKTSPPLHRFARDFCALCLAPAYLRVARIQMHRSVTRHSSSHVINQGKTLTFGEVDDLTDSLAGWLYDKGVRVGSAVGIFMEHKAEYALAYIAAHKVRIMKGGACSRDTIFFCDRKKNSSNCNAQLWSSGRYARITSAVPAAVKTAEVYVAAALLVPRNRAVSMIRFDQGTHGQLATATAFALRDWRCHRSPPRACLDAYTYVSTWRGESPSS